MPRNQSSKQRMYAGEVDRSRAQHTPTRGGGWRQASVCVWGMAKRGGAVVGGVTVGGGSVTQGSVGCVAPRVQADALADAMVSQPQGISTPPTVVVMEYLCVWGWG